MKLKRLTTLLSASALALAVQACGGTSSGTGGDPVLGTAGSGGTYFYVGQGIANAVKKNSDTELTAQATAGGVENLRRVGSGDLQFGFATVGDIRSVLDDDSVDNDDIRVVMLGHLTTTHLVATADSGITTDRQFFEEGRKLGVGEPGSDLQARSQAYLEAFDLDLDDVDGAPLSQDEQATALQDGEIEGASLGGGLPLAAVSELANNSDVTLVPVSDDMYNAVRTDYPEYVRSTIPGGTYPGITKDTESIGYRTVLLTGTDVPDEDVEDVVRTVIDHNADIADVHPAGKEWNRKNAVNGIDQLANELEISPHPAAEATLKDYGLWGNRS